MEQAQARRRQRRPLIEGPRLRCPRDKKFRNILAYEPLDMIEEFRDELNPVLKCPDCSHVFSPRSEVVPQAVAA